MLDIFETMLYTYLQYLKRYFIPKHEKSIVAGNRMAIPQQLPPPSALGMENGKYFVGNNKIITFLN